MLCEGAGLLQLVQLCWKRGIYLPIRTAIRSPYLRVFDLKVIVIDGESRSYCALEWLSARIAETVLIEVLSVLGHIFWNIL